MKRLILLSAVIFSGLFLSAQVGYIDTAYYPCMGINNNLDYSSDIVLGNLVQPDSSIIVYGIFSRCNERLINNIAWLNPDGSNNYSFNPGTGFDAQVNAVARQSDGKLLVGGEFAHFNGSTCYPLVRLNTNGTLDTSFHNTTVTTYDQVYSIIIQPNGQILVGGQSISSPVDIVRLNSNGTKDNAFSSGSTGMSTGVVASMYLLPDSEIIIGGSYLALLKANGTRDSSFPVVSISTGGLIRSVGLQSTGKIIAAGSFSTIAGVSAADMARLNTNGTYDSTFSIGTGFNSTIWSIAMQSNDDIVAGGGFTTYKGSSVSRLVRLGSSGTLDSTFSASANGTVYEVYMDNLGNVFAGGVFNTANTYSRSNFVKLTSTGTVDQTFFSTSGFNANVLITGVQSTGKVIAYGNFTEYSGQAVSKFARLNTDGSLDTSFHTGTGFNSTLSTFYILPSDEILVGGSFTSYNGSSVSYLARLNSDGSLDNTFSAPAFNGAVTSIQVSNAGKIFVSGSFTKVGTTNVKSFARLSASGTYDNTYPGSLFPPQVSGGGQIILQPDNKMLALVDWSNYPGYRQIVIRLDTLGNLDSTFAIASVGDNGSYPVIIGLDPNSGKVYIAGNLSSYDSYSGNSIIRIKSNGTVDSSFNNSVPDSWIYALLPFNSGVVAGGEIHYTSSGINVSGFTVFDSTGATNFSSMYAGTGSLDCILAGNYGYVQSLTFDTVNNRILAGGTFDVFQGNIASNFAGLIYKPTKTATDSIIPPTPLCANATGKLYFKNEIAFNKGNIFTVQLSDTAGNFGSPTAIGTQTATNMGWDSITVTIPGAALTSYHYKMRIVSTNPVFTTASTGYVVIKPNTDTITPGGPTTFCSGSNVTLTSQSQQSYTWNATGGSVTTQGITASASGTYAVTVSSNNCSATASISVTVNSLPTATASNNSPLCAGTTLTLTGGTNSLTSYAWSGPSSYASSSQSPTVSSGATTAMGGTYTITVTNANGCTATASTSATVHALPAASASSNSPVCSYGTINLTASPSGDSYAWSGPNSFSSTGQNPSLAASGNAGAYTTTITDGNSCSASASATITVTTPPTATASNSGPYCPYDTIIFSGGANGLSSYSWFGPGSFSSSVQNPDRLASGNAGTYTITVTDGNGCTASASTSVTVKSLPSASISPADTNVTIGDTVILQASGGGSYNWPQLGTDSPSVPVILTTLRTGYRVKVTDTAGCIAFADAELQAPQDSGSFIILQYWLFNGEGQGHDTVFNANSPMYGCEDSLQIDILAKGGPDSSYQVYLELPHGVLPVPGSSRPSGISSSFDFNEGKFTWTVPPGDTDTLTLAVDLYFNCADRSNQDSIVDPRTDSIFMYSSVNFHNALIYRIYSNIVWPGLTSTGPSNQYTIEGGSLRDTIHVCADSGRIYNLLITSDSGYTGNLEFTNSAGQIVVVPYNSSDTGYIIDSSVFISRFGYPFMAADSCFTFFTEDSFTAPDTCGKRTITFSAAIICNAWDPGSLESSCSGQAYTDNINVSDDGNNYPVKLSTQLFTGGTVTDSMYQPGTNVTAAGIGMCSDTFVIEYTLTNPPAPGMFPLVYNEKIMEQFSLLIDPAWINASQLVALYSYGTQHIRLRDTVYADGQVVVFFPDTPSVILGDSVSAEILLTGLTVNYPSDSQPCSLMGTGQLLGSGTLQYTTYCRRDTFSVDSGSIYSNTVSDYNGYGSPDIPGDTTNSNEISPDQNMTVNFCWSQNQAGYDPWGFTANNGVLPFFDCDSVGYSVQLAIPALVSLVRDSGLTGHYQLTEVADNNITTYHKLTQLTPGDSAGNGVFVATLSHFTSNVCLSATLQVVDSCPPNSPGGNVSVTCNLIANCVDTGTSCNNSEAYCIGEYANTVSVHCLGVCNGTGIGTAGMTMTNLSLIGDTATLVPLPAYACDIIDFRVTGIGYVGDFVPPDSTQEIYLVISYPVADGNDTIFDSSSAIASYSYPGHIDIPINPATIQGPKDSANMWTLIVPITDAAACDSIRSNSGSNFTIDLKLKVKCDLQFSGTGFYNLNTVNAQMEFVESIAGHRDTAYSCDGVAADLYVFDHQYGTRAVFLPVDTNFPCLQTLLIKDSATGGLPYGAEMPGVQRPLITWPTDGSMELSYPSSLSIQKIIYSNSGGFTFDGSLESDTCSPYVSYFDPADLSFGSIQTLTSGNTMNDTTRIYGFASSCGLYSWPVTGKDGLVYFDQLQIIFNKQGCGTYPVTVILPHQQQDGKDSAECADGCNEWNVDTIKNIETMPVQTSGFTASLTHDQIGYGQSGQFTDTLIIRRDSGTGLNNIWIQPYVTGPLSVTINFPDSTTNLMNTTFQPNSDTLIFNIAIASDSNCGNNFINFKIYKNCSVKEDSFETSPLPSDICDSLTPGIYILSMSGGLVLVTDTATGTPSSNIFGNAKGICCRDMKTWTLDMGPALDPPYKFVPGLMLIKSGPAILNIGKILFENYFNSTLQGEKTIQVNAPVNVLSFDFNAAIFDSLNLPHAFDIAGTYLDYITSGYHVKATIDIYGNEDNCGWEAELQAFATSMDACGHLDTSSVQEMDYLFDLNNTVSCPLSSACQNDSFPSICNLCDAFPLNISPQVVEAGCDSSNGSITLHVSGGPPSFDTTNTNNPFGFPTYAYSWTGGDTGSNITHLDTGTYMVTITSGGCIQEDTFSINNSGITYNNPGQTNVTCYGDSNGAIIISASVDSGTLTYSWSNGDTLDSITGLKAGTYTVTITSSIHNSCVDSLVEHFHIDYSDSLALSIGSSGTPIPCHGDSSATVYANVTGGSGFYSYRWNYNSATSSVITSVPAGIYAVTVTDTVNGCSASASYTIDSIAGLTVMFSNTNVSPCYGDSNGVIDASVSGGTPPYAYLWSGDTGTSANLNNLKAGIYTLIVSDDNRCSAVKSDTLISPTEILVDTLVTNVLCYGVNTGKIVLYPSGGTPPYSYSWSHGSTLDSLSSLGAGLYMVTVTDSAGCSVSETISVGQPASGIIINAIQDIMPTCHGDTNGKIVVQAFDGLPPFTYWWSSSDSTDSIVNLGAGTYTITVEDQIGCTATASFSLSNPPVMQFSAAVLDTPCYFSSNGCIKDSAFGGVGTIIYNWNNEGHGYDICNLEWGTYTVTATDSLGCSIRDTVTLPQRVEGAYQCCFTNPNASFIPITTDTPTSKISIPPGSDVYIAPGVTLTVNTSSFTLQNCEVVLGDSAQIVVDAGDTLNILGSYLHGCDTMWLGITVNNGASINLDSLDGKRDTIADAVYGITMASGNPGEEMLIRHSDFQKNEYSVVLYNYIPSNYSYDISDCYFGMSTFTQMLPEPRGYENTTHPIAGIVSEWSSPIDITYGFDTLSIPNPYLNGLPNTFQYMNTGIYCINSPANVFTNTFDSIRNYESVNPYGFYGAAVVGSPNFHSVGQFNVLLVKTAAIPADTSASIRFNNCDVGINAQNYLITALNNRMENVTYGIYTKNCNYQVTIDSNYINNTAYGISLINNSSAAQTIDTNIIYVYPDISQRHIIAIGYSVHTHLPIDTIYGTTYVNGYGIDETEITSSSTVIKHNAIYRGLNGIELNNAVNTQVADNYIHLANDTAVSGNQAGLYSANGTNILVSNNTFDGDSDYYEGLPDTLSLISTRFRKSGLSFYNTYSGNVCDNIFGGTTSNAGLGYGMLYAGNCNNVNLYSNEMYQSWFGLTLLSNVIIPVIKSQGNPGTTYQDNNFVGGFTGGDATFSYISSPINFLFYYLSSQSGTTYTPTNNGTNSISGSGVKFVATAGASLACQRILLPPPHHGSFDSIVAKDSVVQYLQSGFDTTDAKWLVEKMLFQSLYGDTATLNNDSLLNTFFVNQDSGEMKLIMESAISNGFLTDSATLADTVSFGPTPSGYADSLTNARNLTNQIPDSIEQAANYKAMSNIYLNTIIAGIDTFTNGQWDTIKCLAKKCPYVAGDAVYMARALYAEVDNTIFFNDLAICQPSRSERMLMLSSQPSDTSGGNTPVEFVHLYPNPAKQIINLAFYAQTTGQVEFEILDQLGEVVLKAELSEGQTFAQYSVSNLSSGIYYWRLMDVQRAIKVDKVAIIK